MHTEISFIDPDALQAFCEPSQRAPYAVCFGASTTAARLVSACVVAFSSQRMPKNVYSWLFAYIFCNFTSKQFHGQWARPAR